MINIQKLSFCYSKRKSLYEDLNLESKAGSIIGLLGKNGAGKSTLLKLMAGLLKPQNGKMLIMDHVPFQRKPSYLQDVYFVPEEFSIASTSIKSYLQSMAPLYPNFDHGKMKQVLLDFKLEENQNLGKMSYGQKKKFLIAFALSTNCKLLLLDEPTNGLDIPSKALFRKVMAGALSDDQLVIISTHQVKDVDNLIDRIVLVDDGRIKFNKSIISVTEKYAFHTVSELNEGDFLYSEVAPGGYRVLTSKNGVETPLDIELLFNALTNGINLEIHE
ncbi:ABC transporter ATP-binding protein [Marinifilum breve]|uniref:ABC transporter ATP-binding protein n=1 Tax=Marinifilum breve TaxID=2184082 RepID=A0A2V3ZXD3_9BACT|nr:ABC transporter ATP-binding protein [Marinifilum breve]PXY01345.1 ABC transporter ATP-binding protein [Marinifilum breve]